MIEVIARFKVKDTDEMQRALDILKAFCSEDVEGEMYGSGYLYDDGEEINNVLRRLCENEGIDDWRNIPIKSLGFSRRVYNCLYYSRARIERLGELIGPSSAGFWAIRGFGEKSFEEVRDCLGRFGFTLHPCSYFYHNSRLYNEEINDKLKRLCEDEGVDDWCSLPIESLGLPTRVYHCLSGYYQSGLCIKTLGELLEHSESELLALRFFGSYCLSEVERCLRQFDLYLHPSPTH